MESKPSGTMQRGRAILASVLEFLLRLLRWLAVVGAVGFPLSILSGWAFLQLALHWGILVDVRSLTEMAARFAATSLTCFALAFTLRKILSAELKRMIGELRQSNRSSPPHP